MEVLHIRSLETVNHIGMLFILVHLTFIFLRNPMLVSKMYWRMA